MQRCKCLRLFRLILVIALHEAQRCVALSQDFSRLLLDQRKYLIASMPDSRQVVYCRLPDNVWRPLVIGNLSKPTAVAVDSAHSRLFVADSAQQRIFWYRLRRRDDGFLITVGQPIIAVHGYSAYWLAVNGEGDLYFTGHEVVKPPNSAYDSVYRQDVAHIEAGDAFNVQEVYTSSNSGVPTPRVFKPGGIAVDNFYIYWGNQESGSTSGSVNKGSRMNVDVDLMVLDTLSNAVEEVRGLAATFGNIYFVSLAGVHGVSKSPRAGQASATSLIGGVPIDPSKSWDPRSLAWDGGGTLYLTDYLGGAIYELPGSDLDAHNFTKFADAQGVHGVAVFLAEEAEENQAASFLSDSNSGGVQRATSTVMVMLCSVIASLLSGL